MTITTHLDFITSYVFLRHTWHLPTVLTPLPLHHRCRDVGAVNRWGPRSVCAPNEVSFMQPQDIASRIWETPSTQICFTSLGHLTFLEHINVAYGNVILKGCFLIYVLGQIVEKSNLKPSPVGLVWKAPV